MNPFLYSLGNFALKNIGLPPGAGWGCFQSSQDKVLLVTIADSNPANVVFWQSGSFFCVCFSLFWPKEGKFGIFLTFQVLVRMVKCTGTWVLNLFYSSQSLSQVRLILVFIVLGIYTLLQASHVEKCYSATWWIWNDRIIYMASNETISNRKMGFKSPLPRALPLFRHQGREHWRGRGAARPPKNI